jgi:endonuclease/exonuclease/phosphatase family metal-dependent hydrolase
MGDFNAHYSYEYENIYQFLHDNDLHDAWLELIHPDQLPTSSKTFPESNILAINSKTESIDKIFYRSNSQIQFRIPDYNLEDIAFQDKGKPLSDHHPVSVRFAWKIMDVTMPGLLAAGP